MLLPLILSLFIFLPDEVKCNCHDHRYGAPSKSCKRIKDAKFQIRGDIKIVPMWKYILIKEPTGKRVKRSTKEATSSHQNTTVHQNGTLHAAHSAGRTVQYQPLPFNPAQRWTQNVAPHPIPQVRHHTLIQPVDSSVPIPSPQRHIVQSQVQPLIRLPPVLTPNPYNLQPYPGQKLRQEVYPASQPQYGNGVPNQSQSQKNVPQQYQGRQQKVTNYNQAPKRQPYTRPQQQVSPPHQAVESSDWSGRNGGGYHQPKRKGKNRTNKKKKKGKKTNTSKMCKMCSELSEEDDSEEKEVACGLCEKSSKRKKGKKKGHVHSTLKTGKSGRKKNNKSSEQDDSDEHNDDDDESPEGEGAQVEDITEGDGEDGDYNDDEIGSTTRKPTTISQPTIIDYVERTKQNKLMRIPVYRGKKLGTDDTYGTASGEGGDQDKEEEKSEFSTNIREAEKSTKYSDKPNVKYSYPPKDTLPLQTCFHNPSGYVCCNLELNNVVESTYKEVKEMPNFNPCNLQLIANKVQRASEKMFGHPFESIVSHADFAQNINFSGDLVCKLEIDGKYMIAYGTPYHADDAVGPQGPDGNPLPVRSLKI